MRYALRKQDKIASVFGADYLKKHVMRSLDSFFGNIDDDRIADAIELNGYQTHSGENYNVLRCNDVADNDAMLEFAVIVQQFDVLHLSFLGRIKG